MEQSAYTKAQNLLFEEHSVFDEEELLVDNEVPLEKLGIYLNKSIKEKKMTVKEELDEKMIFQMIERREWNENSVIYLYLSFINTLQIILLLIFLFPNCTSIFIVFIKLYLL